MVHRVIQWGTGNVGREALRGIIEHPDLELVGMCVHSAEKVGRDAGELIGLTPVGVMATDDVDAVLARDADCLCYTATGDLRPREAVDDMVRVLAAGKNVVSSSVVPLVYPPAVEPRVQAKLRAACERGNTSCFTSGIDPGFANDLLPLTLMGWSERVESVRIMEILNYATYQQPETLFEVMGFGKPLDFQALMLLPGALTMVWGPVVEMLAAALDVQLDSIRESIERWAAEREYDVGLGVVPKGTMSGLRFEVQGIVRGEPRIVVEHVTRIHDDTAPQWPQPFDGGSYRILIAGDPAMRCELSLRGTDGDHNTGGIAATAMRLVNAIPAVCAAPPGLLSPLELPLVTGRHLLR